MSRTLTERNIDALRQGLADAESRVGKLEDRAAKLEHAISALLQRTEELDKLLRIERASHAGHGPTVR